MVEAPVVYESDDFSLASGLDSSVSSCDTQSDIKIDDIIDVSDGLSMMAQEVHSDGTTVDVKGQRSNIFQSECKIQDKVCKLIIDGGSFTNAISSDVVHALSLSMRRLPTPRYIQWMNHSGTLKITHRVRVKFSVGSYVDIVDCDVAPLSACHLLLGRPWQFDLDATHSGRSNNYSFMHKGIQHVLKPVSDSAIKAKVFATVKKKKKVAAEIAPKLRTALLREGENNVALSAEIVAYESSSKDLPSKVASASNIGSVSNDVVLSDPPISNQCGSFVSAINVSCMKPLKTREIVQLKNDDVKIIPKPRTALFQGGEDNEPRPSHDISVPAMISMGSSGKVLKELQSNFVIIGSALIEIENNCSCILSTEATVPSKLIFKSDTTREKGKTLADGYVIKNQEQGQCSSGEIIKPSVFYVGSMQVVIPT